MKKPRIVVILLALVMALVLGCFAYVSDAYAPDPAAFTAMEGSPGVAVQTGKDYTAFCPEAPTVGILFYPGGKVEPEAYAPLLLALAERDILTILIPMPGNLAVLNPGAAEGVAQQFPQVQDWYIAGHSLGGSMAASYAAKHPEELKGLILLAAYSTADLRGTDLKVLSLYGQHDGVLNMEKYESNRIHFPGNPTERVIPGGNHAGFGSYGPQKGDGEASISAGEQMQFTVQAIADFLS